MTQQIDTPQSPSLIESNGKRLAHPAADAAPAPIPGRPGERLLPALVLALAFFAFATSALVSRTVFERLPHLEDEVTYLFQARLLAGGHSVITSPDPARSYWQPFVVDYKGSRFGKYPLGWPLLLAPGVLMRQPWIINALLSALTVALVYRLGREIFNPDAGVIAALLVAFSPMALLLNGSLMGHTSALFATTLFMYAYWRIERGRRRVAWGVVAGLALGFVVINRPVAALAVAAPFVMWSGVQLVRALVISVKGEAQIVGAQHAAPLQNDNDVPHQAEGLMTRANGSADVAELQPTYEATDKGLEPLTNEQSQPAGVRAPRRTIARFQPLIQYLKPMVALTLVTAVLAAIIPLYQDAATGDPKLNPYTLVWSYDTVGYGPEVGRHGHTLEKGYRQTRWDLSLTAADLFGWQLEPISMYTPSLGDLARPGEVVANLANPDLMQPDLKDHLLNQGDYWTPIGYSFILLPFGLLIGLLPLLRAGNDRQNWRFYFLAAWVIVGEIIVVRTAMSSSETLQEPRFGYLWLAGVGAWLFVSFIVDRQNWRFYFMVGWAIVGVIIAVGTSKISSVTLQEPRFGYLWLAAVEAWLFVPFIVFALGRPTPQAAWTWLLVGVIVTMVIVYTAYWVGSQRYSTRYYFEALAAAALLSALPLAWLARRGFRPVVYVVLLAASAFFLYYYTTPRVTVLYRFNWIGPDMIQAVEARRQGDQPVLVLVTGGNVLWRSMGPLMAVTSPYLNSDIVVAWDTTAPGVRQKILDRFPDRQVIEMAAEGNRACFGPAMEQDTCFGSPPAAPG
jgi:hypothetical protein